MSTTTKTVNLTKVVDKLGQVKAEIADLEVTEKQLRDQIVETGLTEAKGKLFRATVSVSEMIKVDYRAVVEELQSKLANNKVVISLVSQLLKQYTDTTSRTTVKVVSR
jgi:hypothetical protein